MTGKSSERHTGFIISGEMKVRDCSGNEYLIHVGEAFEVSENHDAWVHLRLQQQKRLSMTPLPLNALDHPRVAYHRFPQRSWEICSGPG